MSQLKRMLLSNVGYRSAYYSGVMLNFCNAETNQPENSIIWLANQGGKTTLISLLFTNIEPAKRRFVQHLQKQDHRFEDYFNSTPGVVALELKMGASDLTGEAPSLIIGQCVVLQDNGTTQRIYFGFSSNNKLNISDLPFEGAYTSTKLKTMAEFKLWLEQASELNSTVYSVENQSDWKKWLDTKGVEHELLAKQIDFCRSEGGISDFASFKDEKAFLEQFLMLALDESIEKQAHKALQKAHEQYKTMPELEAKQGIYTTLLNGFQEIQIPAAKYQTVIEAVADHDQQLITQLQAIQSRQQWLNLQVDDLKRQADKLKTESDLNQQTLAETQNHLKRTQLSLLVQRALDAQSVLIREQTDQALSTDYLTVLKGVDAWDALQKVKITHDELTKTINDASQDIAPKEQELRGLGSRLVSHYTALITLQNNSVVEAESEQNKIKAAVKENEAHKKSSQLELGQYETTRDKAIQWLESYEEHKSILAEKRYFVTTEGEPLSVTNAGAYWQKQYTQQTETLETNQSRQKTILQEQKNNDRDFSNNEISIATLSEQLSQLKITLEDVLNQKGKLESSPILCKLINMSRANADNISLLEKLDQQLESLQYNSQKSKQRLNDLTTQKNRLEEDRLAKPDENTEQALQWLKDQGLEAFYYPHYINGQNLSVDAARELVESDPARFYGIQVNNLSKVQQALKGIEREALGLSQPVVISEGCNEINQRHEHIVLPVRNDAAYNEEAAKALLLIINTELDTLVEELATQESTISNQRIVRDRLSQYQLQYDKQWWDDHKRKIPEKENKLAEAIHARETMQQSKQALEQQFEALTLASAAILPLQQHALLCHAAVDNFIKSYESNLAHRIKEKETVLTTIGELIARLVELDEVAEISTDKLAEIGKNISALQASIENTNTSRSNVAYTQVGTHNVEIDIVSIRQYEAEYSACERSYGALLREKGLDELKGELRSITTNLSDKQTDYQKVKGSIAQETIATEAERISLGALELPTLISRQEEKVTQHNQAIGGYSSYAHQAESQLGEYKRNSPNIEVLDNDLSVSALEASLKQLQQTLESSHKAALKFTDDSLKIESKEKGFQAEIQTIEVGLKFLSPDLLAKSQIATHDLTLAKNIRVNEVLEKITHLTKSQRQLFDQKLQIKSEVNAHFKKSILPIAENQEKAALLGALATDIKYYTDQQLIDHSEDHILTMRDAIEMVESQITVNKDKLELINSSFDRLLDEADNALHAAFRVKIPEDMMHYSGKAILKSKLTPKNKLRQTLSQSQRSSMYLAHIKSNVNNQSIDEDGYKLATAFLIKSYELVLADNVARVKNSLLNIQIIKPHDVEIDYIPVDKMIGSGGEGLTAGLLLYLVIANIRGESMGQGQIGQSGSFLLLDNPFSKANKIDLIRPQTQLAKKLNIQLIFATGIEDLNAIGEFEHVIRLRKDRMDANSKRQYIEHDQPQVNASKETDSDLSKYRIQAVDYSYRRPYVAQEH